MLQSIGYALLGNGVVAAGLALLALLLGSRGAVYLAGLSAAVIAYVIALTVRAVLMAFVPEGPPSSIAPLLDPAIEEPLRIFFLSAGASTLAQSDRATGAALAFAFGYALFEAVVKAIDLVLVYSRTVSAGELLVVLGAPAVVLALHLALSLLAAILFARGVSANVVLRTTFFVHAAHNASVLWLPRPEEFTTLGLVSLLRIALFAAVIWYCLAALHSRDLRRATLKSFQTG